MINNRCKGYINSRGNNIRNFNPGSKSPKEQALLTNFMRQIFLIHVKFHEIELENLYKKILKFFKKFAKIQKIKFTLSLNEMPELFSNNSHLLVYHKGSGLYLSKDALNLGMLTNSTEKEIDPETVCSSLNLSKMQLDLLRRSLIEANEYYFPKGATKPKLTLYPFLPPNYSELIGVNKLDSKSIDIRKKIKEEKYANTKQAFVSVISDIEKKLGLMIKNGSFDLVLKNLVEKIHNLKKSGEDRERIQEVEKNANQIAKKVYNEKILYYRQEFLLKLFEVLTHERLYLEKIFPNIKFSYGLPGYYEEKVILLRNNIRFSAHNYVSIDYISKISGISSHVFILDSENQYADIFPTHYQMSKIKSFLMKLQEFSKESNVYLSFNTLFQSFEEYLNSFDIKTQYGINLGALFDYFSIYSLSKSGNFTETLISRIINFPGERFIRLWGNKSFHYLYPLSFKRAYQVLLQNLIIIYLTNDDAFMKLGIKKEKIQAFKVKCYNMTNDILLLCNQLCENAYDLLDFLFYCLLAKNENRTSGYYGLSDLSGDLLGTSQKGMLARFLRGSRNNGYLSATQIGKIKTRFSLIIGEDTRYSLNAKERFDDYADTYRIESLGYFKNYPERFSSEIASRENLAKIKVDHNLIRHIEGVKSYGAYAEAFILHLDKLAKKSKISISYFSGKMTGFQSQNLISAKKRFIKELIKREKIKVFSLSGLDGIKYPIINTVLTVSKKVGSMDVESEERHPIIGKMLKKSEFFVISELPLYLKKGSDLDPHLNNLSAHFINAVPQVAAYGLALKNIIPNANIVCVIFNNESAMIFNIDLIHEITLFIKLKSSVYSVGREILWEDWIPLPPKYQKMI